MKMTKKRTAIFGKEGYGKSSAYLSEEHKKEIERKKKEQQEPGYL